MSQRSISRSQRPSSRVLSASAVLILFAAGASVAGWMVAGRDGGDRAAAPSVTYHKGWIFHERREITMVPYPGAGRYAHLTTERWKETAPPYRSRIFGYPAYWTESRVEMGSSGRVTYAYDPASNAIYEQANDATRAPFIDPAAYNRRMIESGRWKIAKTTAIDGREVLRIDNPLPTVTYFVDADSYVLVRVESSGFPLAQRGKQRPGPPCSYSKGPETPGTTNVDEVQTYEYLPPTKSNLKLLDISAQHPDAHTAPAISAPRQFKLAVKPPQCSAPPRP